MSRKFCGVDLDKNYAEAMLHTESIKRKREYAKKRDFKNMCLRLERYLCVGMIVVTRDMKMYSIIDIRGRRAEEKEIWLGKPTGREIFKRKITDVYPLEWWINERDKVREGEEYCPRWFRLAEELKRR